VRRVAANLSQPLDGPGLQLRARADHLEVAGLLVHPDGQGEAPVAFFEITSRPCLQPVELALQAETRESSECVQTFMISSRHDMPYEPFVDQRKSTPSCSASIGYLCGYFSMPKSTPFSCQLARMKIGAGMVDRRLTGERSKTGYETPNSSSGATGAGPSSLPRPNLLCRNRRDVNDAGAFRLANVLPGDDACRSRADFAGAHFCLRTTSRCRWEPGGVCWAGNSSNGRHRPSRPCLRRDLADDLVAALFFEELFERFQLGDAPRPFLR